MNIRFGPASVVSAEPILFPLPLCRLPRLMGFAVTGYFNNYYRLGNLIRYTLNTMFDEYSSNVGTTK